MRSPHLAAAAVASLLLPAAPALAGDPIMPLGEVRAGMACTGYSVVRGTDVAAFDVEVIDVIDDRATGSGARILFRASGPAIDDTGIGPGFSGSPIYCADALGTPRNVGAISEGIGEYGGKVALATPIEAILGSPVDPPRSGSTPVARANTRSRAARLARARPRARRVAALLARARPLTAPLTVTGLAPRLGAAVQQAAAARGRLLLAAPVGPLGSFPVQPMRPGAAFGVGFSSGDIVFSATGTVAYVDGDRVWGFGHPLEGVGARSLLLQDAYVYRVVNNPIGSPLVGTTYKFAAAGHDIGTITNDALSAVVGRVGGLPPTVPLRVFAKDMDTGVERAVISSVADESDVDQPSGSSILPLLGSLAVGQAAGTVLGGSPARLTGRACFVVTLRELPEPARFCNRYVTDTADLSGAGNVVASAAGSDLLQALALVDGYKASPVHVTSVEAFVRIRRGQRQAYLRRVELPRRARAGRKVRATVTLRHVRGELERRRVRLAMPEDLRPGRRRLVFTGTDVDTGDGGLFEFFEFDFDQGNAGGELGPPNVRRLGAAIEALGRYDGVSVRRPGEDPDEVGAGKPSFRLPGLRVSGTARATVRVRR